MKLIYSGIVALAITLSFSISSFAQAPKNLNLLSSISFAPQSLAGCWHYENSGKSYALLGASGGLVVVDVTTPASPVIVLQVPGINNLWREVKVEGQYAYVVTEGRDSTGVLDGLQIVNLSYLPDSAPSKIYKGDGPILNQLFSAHTITSANGFIYINGHNIISQGRGVLICDISDPWNPVFVGAVTNYYCHDSYVRGDTIWTSDIQAGQFSVYDISDRSNPVLLATQPTPGNFNHNSWLSDDGLTLFTTDERNNEPVASFDVSDLSNITLLDSYLTTNFSSSEVHNVRVLNDYLVNPSYGSQLTLVDASRPSNLIEVGNYTTGQILLWDADPYLSSGVIIATDMNPGVFYIFDPVYQRACYLEGLITDSLTGVPIPAATVEIMSAGIQKNSNGSGNYYTGVADPGTFDVQFSKIGYESKLISGVNLNTASLTTLDIELKRTSSNIESVPSGLIQISPNPSNRFLKISSDQRPIDEITLYNLMGAPINSWIPNSTGLNYTLDMQSLPNGIYLLKFSTGQNSVFKKIVKN